MRMGPLGCPREQTLQCWTPRWHITSKWLEEGKKTGFPPNGIVCWNISGHLWSPRPGGECGCGVNGTAVSEYLDNELVIRGLGGAGKSWIASVGSRASSAHSARMLCGAVYGASFCHLRVDTDPSHSRSLAHPTARNSVLSDRGRRPSHLVSILAV